VGVGDPIKEVAFGLGAVVMVGKGGTVLVLLGILLGNSCVEYEATVGLAFTITSSVGSGMATQELNRRAKNVLRRATDLVFTRYFAF
jgi:hypothetical protein